MVTTSYQSGEGSSPLPTAGNWDAARAATLAASLFSNSAQFAPVLVSSLWSLWLTVIFDPFGLL